MSNPDKVVLNYENTQLRQSDLDLLEDRQWINDNLIAFWFEFLECEIFQNFKQMFGFVCPQVVHLMKFGSQDEIRSIVDGLELSQKAFVLLPINDCREQMLPGGSHWSLLVYNNRNNIFEHYDSSHTNLSEAEGVAEILAPFLLKERSDEAAKVLEMSTVQQSNSYDCGMHVICNSYGLCKKHAFGDDRALSEIVSASDVSRSREKLRRIIVSFSRECFEFRW